MNPLEKRIADLVSLVKWGKEIGLHFYLRAIEDINGARVTVRGREMLMFASYCYLGLLGHPKINAAAKDAIEKFGSGTHGVRILAGTTTLHDQLEARISAFKDTEAAIVYPSGYVTNLATISTLCGRDDVVICDKLNHASIVDGCLLSRAKFVRFEHNNMEKLEAALAKAKPDVFKLVVVDAVFSMDGDIINLPEVSRLAKKYGAWLMVDEAHSLGVLGKTGHGIEEHFGLEDAVDIKMGTLSKTIPSVGGYIAAKEDVITYLKHTSRAFVFSAALPPAAVAAAKASFDVIEEEPERIATLRRNVNLLLNGLKERGFNTLNSETPVIPIVTGEDEKALYMTKISQEEGIFVLPVLPPAVPHGTSRLRVCVTASHTEEDIKYALDVFERAGKEVGVI
ncbi:MAG: aminotransferase class I/II-fold pyridoxal phosphate-dependent enzyme [Anaerolineae bacterium]